jgi:hypothetical protein
MSGHPSGHLFLHKKLRNFFKNPIFGTFYPTKNLNVCDLHQTTTKNCKQCINKALFEIKLVTLSYGVEESGLWPGACYE